MEGGKGREDQGGERDGGGGPELRIELVKVKSKMFISKLTTIIMVIL